jgi:hypothetical protein
MVLNYQLISRLNTSDPPSWIVVYNDECFMSASQKEFRKLANKGKTWSEIVDERTKTTTNQKNQDELLAHLPSNFVVKGASLREAFTHALDATDDSNVKIPRELRALKSLASYHHALGIELALNQVKTRFVVLTDPDFYVVQSNWVSRVVRHMLQNKLAIFGAPWNPRWYQKFRDFPCTHLMVIDRERLRGTHEVAVPDLVRGSPKFISRFWTDRAKEWNKTRLFRWRSLLRHPWQAFREEWLQRRTIGTSRDTGFKMRSMCQKLGLEFESLTPVFDPEVDGFEPATISPIQIHPLVQLLLSDDRVYLPKRRDSYSRTGFKERGFPNFRCIGWEEFLWQKEPFAFHVRGERRKVSGRDLLYLSHGLQTILRRQHMSPLPDIGPGEEDEYPFPLGLIESPQGLMPRV